MENEEKLESLKLVNNAIDSIDSESNTNSYILLRSELVKIKNDLEKAQIFKNRMRILERDNYKVIKVDIFSDVPGFVEEYNKIIDWNGDNNEKDND